MYQNGNGSGTVAPRVLNGRGIAHRNLDKRQRAVLGADLADGQFVMQPSVQQIARLLGVSVDYIGRAHHFSPDKRAAILAGRDRTNFSPR